MRLARDLWLPGLVAALGIALAVVGWSHLVAERHRQIREMAAEVADQSRRTAATSVRHQLLVLRNLAGLWSFVGRRPLADWRADVDFTIGSFPHIDYVAWIHADAVHRASAGKHEPSDAVRIEPSEAHSRSELPRIAGPERSEDGTPGLQVFLPVDREGGTDLGVLEARVNLASLLADVLKESAPGYAIRIHWARQEIYRRGEPSGDPRQRWWREEGIVALPLGAAWTMSHAPTPELAAAWLSSVPHYLLAVGVLLALAAGVLAHHLRLGFLRARFLSEGNIALEASAGELRQLNEALERRVAARTAELEAFNHSISHDLRSPLGAILNFATILEVDAAERLEESDRDALARIRRSALRGSAILDGLLRLSRAAHLPLDVTGIDMEALARESFEQVRTREDDSVELLIDPLPAARGDRTLVGEVLAHLFDNALKYSRGCEKRRIAVRGACEDGECIYEIADNGRGFEMRYADKLFRVFERLHSSPEIPGSGVGLAMVARIIERHGGRVWAESDGAGTRMSFTLPQES